MRVYYHGKARGWLEAAAALRKEMAKDIADMSLTEFDPDLVELAKQEVKELLGQRLGDMRGLIIRLARALKKASPGNELSGQALDYLARNGMGPNPLRDNAALTDGVHK